MTQTSLSADVMRRYVSDIAVTPRLAIDDERALGALMERGLPPENYGLWLGDEPSTPEVLKAILKPFPAEQMEAYPVGFGVSKAGSEGAVLLEPIGEHVQPA